MRKYELHEAANFLYAWVTGTLERQPLLDVSATLDWVWPWIYTFLLIICFQVVASS